MSVELLRIVLEDAISAQQVKTAYFCNQPSADGAVIASGPGEGDAAGEKDIAVLASIAFFDENVTIVKELAVARQALLPKLANV